MVILQVVSEERKETTELSDFLGYKILYLPIFLFFGMPCFKKCLTLFFVFLVFLVLENIHYVYG